MSKTTSGLSTDALATAGPVADAPASRRNTWLRRVLWLKIIATLVWCAALLFPGDNSARLGFPQPSAIVFLRLLGAAFLALLVGYVRGLRALRAGRAPTDAVVVGIVSNGLASAMLIGYGAAGDYAGWGWFAQFFMWVSAVVTAVVTIGLVAFRPR